MPRSATRSLDRHSHTPEPERPVLARLNDLAPYHFSPVHVRFSKCNQRLKLSDPAHPSSVAVLLRRTDETHRLQPRRSRRVRSQEGVAREDNQVILPVKATTTTPFMT